jgi:phosphoribosylformimino-5-aminoimidazole carboxamide ribotide isomerase
MGRGDNFEAITSIMSRVKVPIQVGGGIRTTEAAETLLNLGASRVVVGTRAITDPEWFYDLVRTNRNRIILALDTKDGKIQLKGWKESSESKLRETLRSTENLPLAGVLHTNVNVEGKAKGIDIEETKHAEEKMRQSAKLESLSVLSGGIAHDFNNLLVGILGGASLLEDYVPKDSPAHELVTGLERAGERAAALVKQILAYSGHGRFV